MGNDSNRDQVREEFGVPLRVEVDGDDEADVFVVHGMVPDKEMATVCLMGVAGLFIPELYFFPKSLVDLPGRISATHELEVYYYDNGDVKNTGLTQIEETK